MSIDDLPWQLELTDEPDEGDDMPEIELDGVVVGGEASQRILREVMMGLPPAQPDTELEAEHRAALVEAVEAIRADGSTVDAEKELP